MILPSGNTFDVGNDISIQCEVRGYPPPTTTWTKDNIEIEQSDRIRISGRVVDILSYTKTHTEI